MERLTFALATVLLLFPACKKPGDESAEPPARGGDTRGSAPAKPAEPPSPPPDAELTELVSSQNAFALDLYDHLRAQQGNLAFSPASANAALAMTYAGARRDTAVAMKTTLHLEITGKKLHRAYQKWLAALASAPGHEGPELALANRLWADRGLSILADFASIPAEHYGAPVEQLDFLADLEGSRNAINAWTEEQTRDRIKELLQPGVINESTRLVLTNAIYFAGTWAEKFDADQTSAQAFHAPDGDVQVPMMNQTGDFPAAEAAGSAVLQLPYAGKALSMLIFLPDTRDGLPALEARLGKQGLDGLLTGLSERRVSVALPRFTLEASFNLAEVLAEMGMRSAFTSGEADLSGITGNRDLFLSAVIHKAFVKVDEKGTEAAAATAVTVAPTGMPAEVLSFVADHPFLFAIRDERTGSILFLGRVIKPTE